ERDQDEDADAKLQPDLSPVFIHWLASPAAAARTAIALLMRIPLAALVSRSGQEGPDRRIVSGQHRLGRAEGAEPPVDEDGHAVRDRPRQLDVVSDNDRRVAHPVTQLENEIG